MHCISISIRKFELLKELSVLEAYYLNDIKAAKFHTKQAIGIKEVKEKLIRRVSTLINEKISFGIANLHFRYAHTSIIQNISAIYFYNQIEYDSFSIIPGLIYSVTAYFIFQKMTP